MRAIATGHLWALTTMLAAPIAGTRRCARRTRETWTEGDKDAMHPIELADPRSLTYRQLDTARAGRWRVTKSHVTDPPRAIGLVDVRFESLPGRTHAQFVWLARSLDARTPVERPARAACRYLGRCL